MSIPARHITPEAFRAWQEESRRLDETQIVFIVGPPKSGTTWLARSLGAHPRIALCMESQACNGLLPRMNGAFREYCARRAEYTGHPESEPTPLDFAMLQRQAIDRILLRTIRDAEGGGNKRVSAVVEKTPLHAKSAGLLAGLYPGAKFICCVRDPRDGAVSGWSHFRRGGRVQQSTIEEWALHYVHEMWAPCLTHARAAGSALGPEGYLEVRYEDHKEDTPGVLRGVLEFIGLDAGDEPLAACLQAGDFRRLSGGRSPGEESANWSFYRKGVVGDWRSHFSEAFGARLLREAQAALEGRSKEQWLRSCLWRQAARRCEAMGMRRIALYGAGRHTRDLLESGWPGEGLEVVAILDDQPTEAQILGAPVMRPAQLAEPVDAVVISSEVHEQTLADAAARSIGAHGTPVLRIYEPELETAPSPAAAV